jgi:chromosome segregation ATPase
MVIAEERKRFRHELDKLRRSFNEDILTVKRALQSDFNRHRNVTRGELEDARKRIAELQRKVDDLTFEKTFATSKIIDLPPLPLRGSRHG